MCSSPSRPGRMFTNAPNLVMFTTLPGVHGADLRHRRVEDRARCGGGPPRPARRPSTRSSPCRRRRRRCTETSAPVSSVIALMTLPFGPITSPILSIGISKLTIFGARSRTSERGARRSRRAGPRAPRGEPPSPGCSAWARTSAGRPSIFVSSCRAVTNSAVPATLKSMSPNASSAPRMSVSVVYLPSA